MGYVKVGEKESIESALRRFKRSCQNSGVFDEMKRMEYFEKPSVRKRREIEACKKKVKSRLNKINRKVDKLESM